MIKVVSFSSGVRTRCVLGRVSIIWLFAAFGISVSEGVELQTISQVAAQCGDNVTLICEASSSRKLDIRSFSWLDRHKSVCKYEDGRLEPEDLCDNTPHYRLTLTLSNVMPLDEGSYLCKLSSRQGIESAKTDVTVQDCLGSSDSSINKTHGECRFSGVYPNGTVHWHQGDVNLTDSASTQEEKDQYGRYNIRSTIDLQGGNLSLPYNCSLWIPSAEKYLSTKQLPKFQEQRSAAHMVKLQWICLMVEIMMVTFTR